MAPPRLERAAAVFGAPLPGARYWRRAGAYAVIPDGQGRVAMARHRQQLHLPGGGIDPGETHDAALLREVREETGLVVAIERWFAEAEEYAWSESLGPFLKAGRFAIARVVERAGDPIAGHELVWSTLAEVEAQVVGPSQAWAVSTGLRLLQEPEVP
jgi:8-oxo-dGTP diphosphatase